MISIFLLLQIIRIYSENYSNYCFQIFGYFQQQINILFSDNLHFVPDVLRLNTLLKENTFDSEIRIVRKQSFILQKMGHPCEENFIYHIPATLYPVWTLEIGLSWGPEDFTIDCHAILMKKDFQESLHLLQGAKENILMPVFLKHGNMPYFPPHHSQIHPLPEFNRKVRQLLPGESYCMPLFNREIKEFLVFSQPFLRADQVSEYYILGLGIVTNQNNNIMLRGFLVKIYPCLIPADFDEKFRLFVDPIARTIQFNLSDELAIMYNIRNNIVSSGTALDLQELRPFNFDNLEVKIQPLVKEMVDQRAGVMLYPSTRFSKNCEARIPEDIAGLGLSFILERRFDDVAVFTIFRIVDMATQHLGIFKLRPGTQEEYEQCML